MNAVSLAPASAFSLTSLSSSKDSNLFKTDSAVAVTSAEVGIKTYNLYVALQYRQSGFGNHIAQSQPARTSPSRFLDLGAYVCFPQGIGSFLHRSPLADPFLAKCETSTYRKVC